MPRTPDPTRSNSRIRAFRVTNAAGKLLGFDDEIILTPAETNRQALTDRANQSLAVNAAYLTKPNPTPAEQAAQLRQLTLETSALIRLMMDRIESVDS